MLEPHLDERQRRLVLAARARSLGRGGIGRIALAAGVHPSTVSKGIEELESPGAPSRRARRPGGGRKRLTETDPGLMTALVGLMEPRGQPRPVLQWTTRSTRRLAEELAGRGHRVSAWSVSRLLREAGFRLSSSSRPLVASQRFDRDAQFHRVNEQIDGWLVAGQPVVVITMRRQRPAAGAGPADESALGGRRAEPGRPVGPPRPAGPATGLPTVGAEGGVGWADQPADHGTSAVALATVRGWWSESRQRARQLLLVADVAGTLGASWRTGLTRFAREIDAAVCVSHLPANTMRWNRGEDQVRSTVLLSPPGAVPSRHEVELRVIAESGVRRPAARPPDPQGPPAWNYLVEA
ncbi:ISAzo13-like element transposase-related protein [Micromonospora rubida]|uniref:ISAzo13-like element transposase-related protein n=1 Tax=Micromonospora rubida TaxID=2697657 RepID=UPI001378C86A|nr:hypothetical protein [Micromonospora rubida]NBE79812.1 hypothetical protein [Micromonospora rubida]